MTTITPDGPDFIVNSTTASGQSDPTMTALAGGGFVVTWYSFDSGDGSDTLIRARLYDADGEPVDDDFQVNSSTAGNQLFPTVTALAGGGFVVTWSSGDGGDGAGTLIRARLFDADGDPVDDDFQVNSTTAGDQLRPTVTALAGGGFVVTWHSLDAGDGSGTIIRGRLFDADGDPVADDFQVNSTTTNNQFDPTVTTLADGGFVVTWYSTDTGDGSGSLIRARLFDANGDPVGNDFPVNSTTASDQSAPTVMALAGGGFVVAWYSEDGGDGSGSLIRARLFDAEGGPVGEDDFQVNSTEDGDQSAPTMTALAGGGFIVTWYSEDDGDGSDSLVRARLFDADGNPVGDDFQVNSTAASDQVDPTVTALAGGGFVVTWKSGDGGEGNGTTLIRARLFANDETTITSNGGGADAAVSVAENTTAVTAVQASDVDSVLTYSIFGGADAARFAVDANTGALTFVVAPDFEVRADAGGNNVYDVIVRASDGTLFDDQAIAVMVTNVGGVTVNGTGGRDIFDFNAAAWSFGANADTILAFRHAQHDRIDLRTIDSTPGGANNAFLFAGTQSFAAFNATHNGGAVRAIMGQVQVDVGGNGTVDMIIKTPSVKLVAADFFL